MFSIPTRTEYRLNTRSLAISVYRAIRMGWTPDVVYGQDWPESDYEPLVDTLPASMTDHDFNTFAHRYAKTAGAIYRLSRDAATTEQWFRMYRKLTNQEEPAMNELTRAQLNRQDDVDNIVYDFIRTHAYPTIDATYSLIKALAGKAADGVIETTTAQIETVRQAVELARQSGTDWDMERIASVRDAVQTVLVDELELMTEMEFYPYLED